MFAAEGTMKLLLALAIVSGSILSGFAQIPNASFENWTNSGSAEVPVGWFVASSQAYSSDHAGVRSSANAYAGAWAVAIENMKSENGNVFRAGLKSGSDGTKDAGGFAYSLRPASFNGYLRYQPSLAGDACFLTIQFTRYNPVTQARELIGEGSFSTSEYMWDYEPFSIPVYYRSYLSPDTATITSYAGRAERPQEGSRLELDQFSFDETATGVVIIDGDELGLKVSPNPSSNVIFITNETVANNGVKYSIYNTGGEAVLSGYLEYRKGIDVSALRNGEYFLLIYDAAGVMIAKATFMFVN
jgi:hypothetical protein